MRTLVIWAISSSILILALILLRLCLRGRIPARLQYALWALALVRLLLPVSLFANPWSVASAVERLSERSAAVETAPPIETTGFPAQTTPTVESNSATTEQPGIPTQIITPQQPVISAQPNQRAVPRLSELLAIAWGAGAAVAALWMALANLRLGRRLRRSGRVLEQFGTVPVRVTDQIPSPCLFGLFRPTICLPPAAAESEDLPYILRHERTHLRRGDHVVAALRCLCLALWWWNPLVWAAAVLSRQDGELACDEAILAELGQEQRIAYGQALLNQVPQRGAIRGCSSLSTTMSATARGLKERIRRIVKPKKNRLFLIVLCLALAAALIGCTFTDARPKIELPEQETEGSEADSPEETSDVHISLATMEEILSADLWDFEEDDLVDSLTASGWTVYAIQDGSRHAFLKEIDGYNTALTFEAFDTGMIKAVTLTTRAMSEEKRTLLEEALQNLSASDWSDIRMVALMPVETDFIALCAKWILETRSVAYSVGGTLTDGAMRFSGETEEDLSAVIASFFQLEPDPSLGERGSVTSAAVGEGYFLLPDGSHVQTTAAVNPAEKSARFSLTRYHAEWVDRFGNKPQPSAPDYRPNNVDGYLTITRDPSASSAARPQETDQKQFFALFPELDEESVLNCLSQNPDLLDYGWSGIRIDQAGLDQEGTPIRTIQGDQVLAVDAVNGILLIRVTGDQWNGVLAILKDPSRVGMRWADGQQTVRQIAETNGAVLGISATGASDSSGMWSNGSSTMPYAMCNGESRGSHASGDYKRLELGPDDRVIIVNADSPITPNTTDAIEYAPALIVDGALAITEDTIWNGQYPRSIIGQAENGNMMMLVVQGRDAGGSLGASVYDCAQLLYNYGCVQALNMEGGSTSILYYNGRTVTVCSNPNLTDGRELPNAWLYFQK